MSERKCTTHPEVAASFRCDGCKEWLCTECVEEGHRLLFCRLCGERAMPLAEEAPAVTTDMRRAAKREAPYSLADALRYPFRGLGRFVFWGYVLVLVIFNVLGALPGLGCAVLILRLLVLLILPGLLFRIVRTTAEGETELPDWPDFSEGGQRLWEWLGAILAFVVSLIPLVALLYLLGCDPRALAELKGHCLLALFVGSIASVAVWVPAFGAVAAEWNPVLALRLDLHVRALLVVGADAWKTVGLLVGLLVVRQLLIMLTYPILGGVAQVVIGTYALLVGAHFVGLLFRRHTATLDALYN